MHRIHIIKPTFLQLQGEILQPSLDRWINPATTKPNILLLKHYPL